MDAISAIGRLRRAPNRNPIAACTSPPRARPARASQSRTGGNRLVTSHRHSALYSSWPHFTRISTRTQHDEMNSKGSLAKDVVRCMRHGYGALLNVCGGASEGVGGSGRALTLVWDTAPSRPIRRSRSGRFFYQRCALVSAKACQLDRVV